MRKMSVFEKRIVAKRSRSPMDSYRRAKQQELDALSSGINSMLSSIPVFPGSAFAALTKTQQDGIDSLT